MPNLYFPPVMSAISEDQLAFLDSQGIPLGRVFDATGMRKSEYKAAMKTLDMVLAIGVSPCDKGGHTIRTRHGHCAQCNPAVIAFQNRYSQRGYVYIAGSRTHQLIKIGYALDVLNRMKSLNYFGYGGTNDWLWLHAFDVYNGGRIEHEAQLYLRGARFPTSYKRDGILVDCLETFKYPHEDAEKTIRYFCKNACNYYRNDEAISYYSNLTPQEEGVDHINTAVPLVSGTEDNSYDPSEA